MRNNDSAALERAVTDGRTDLERRDVRALTECMTVLPLGGELYSVTTGSGSEYRVDALEDAGDRPDDCECWDTEQELPCWPCWREGHKTPNPNAGESQ